MNRRRFVNTVAFASLLPLPASAADVAVEAARPSGLFDALLRDIEPGHDDFPLEKQAADIASKLREFPRTGSLPLAPGVRGFSPMPRNYRVIADGVRQAEYDTTDTAIAAGLTKWLSGFRAARFYVLPGDIVRFEIASAGQYRVGAWRLHWSEGRISVFEPLEETITSAAESLFTDVTADAFRNVESFAAQLTPGVNYWRGRIDSASGIDVHGHNGIATGDIDGNGFDDIYICQPAGLPNRLYRNRGGGSFEDITEASGVGILDATSSALFLDLRNSGRQDLVVLRPEGPLLFLNDGEGRFQPRPNAFLFRTPPQGSFTGMAAADYDRDGKIDLYLCTYSFFRDGSQYRYPTPYYDARNGPANYLFCNQLSADGSGSFIDVTAEAGLGQNNNRFSFAPAWCDYNNDGWPDLYVANDFGLNNLYRNDKGRFLDVAAEAGVEDPGDGMSASWFDYDGDGKPDLYISNMWSDTGQRVIEEKGLEPADVWKRHAKGNSLFRNRGDGTFEETGAQQGVEMGRWAWSSGGFDFDNDGTPEIVVATGMLTNESETDMESFFWRKVAAASGSNYENGWNALSQAVHEKYSEAGRQPNVFYVKRGERYYDFSGVSGLDFADDTRAFAATDIDGDGRLDLILKSRLGPQLRVLHNNCAEGTKSIGFRLRGVESNRDAVGARVDVAGHVRFVEAGSGYLSQHTKTLLFGLGKSGSRVAAKVTWPSGKVQEFVDLDPGFTYRITEGQASLEKTPFRTAQKARPAPVTGIDFTGPADTWLLDPIPMPEPFKAGLVKIDHGDMYAVLVRYLFDLRMDLKLPVWFLVDDNNRARRIFFSEPTAVALKEQPKPLPFAGKYYTAPSRNYVAMGAAFAGAGYPEQALRYLELAPQSNDKVLFAIGRIHLLAGRWPQAKTYLERGLAVAPDSADGWNNLGSAEAGSGNMRAAIAAYEKALGLRPDLTSAKINAGQAYAALGDDAGAEKMFLRAPNDAAAANQMGELMTKRHRDPEAKTWFEKSIAARRDYAPAVGNLGLLYARAGQLDDAIAAFRYGLEITPSDETFYLNLASTYVLASRIDAARDTLGRLLTREPQNARAKRALQELEGR